jgi:hypothetical protein
MLDRVLPIALGDTPERGEARNFADTIREYMRRFLRLLSRLIEAGGPMS